MSAWTDVRTIQTGTGTGNLAAVTGLPSAPLALIAFMVRRNGAGVVDGMCGAIGLSAGPSGTLTGRRTSSFIAADAVTTSDADKVFSATQFLSLLPISDFVDVASLDANGYTLAIDNAFPADTTFVVMAIGGSDITNVAGSATATSSAAGNQAVTGVGFQPDVVFFLGGFAGTVGTVTANAATGIGVAKSSSAQWAVSLASADADAAGSNAWGIVSTDLCMVSIDPTTGAIDQSLTFVSMDADGFTWNKSANASGRNIGWLAIKGGRHAVGTTAMVVGTGNQAVSGLSIGTPVGLLLAMRGGVTANEGSTPSAHAEFGIGVTDGTTQCSIWAADEDALATTDNYSSLSTTRVIHDLDKETALTDEGDMTLLSFDADGFTLDQDTAAGVATLIPYWAIGQNAAGGASKVPLFMQYYHGG